MVTKKATKGNYVIVRTYSAGVFAGYLTRDKSNPKCGVIKNARRLWYWAGAASLSELAVRGVSKPGECKFPVAVSEIEVTEIIEVLKCTEVAKESIANVKEWSGH